MVYMFYAVCSVSIYCTLASGEVTSKLQSVSDVNRTDAYQITSLFHILLFTSEIYEHFFCLNPRRSVAVRLLYTSSSNYAYICNYSDLRRICYENAVFAHTTRKVQSLQFFYQILNSMEKKRFILRTPPHSSRYSSAIHTVWCLQQYLSSLYVLTTSV